MILEDGEKYACEHCIRGHRVSSCSHTDRPLHHINRKGRPLSQCQHCRGLRKSRAAHVKCECADHGHARNGGIDKAHATDDQGASHHQCQCMTGKKCNCSIKKEHEEPHKSDPTTATSHNRNISKPPAIAGRRSESAVPRLRSSLHPPLHRSNYAAHESGMPYPHSHRPTAGFRPFHHAQRSVDSLPLLSYATGSSQTQVETPRSFTTNDTGPQQNLAASAAPPLVPVNANESRTPKTEYPTVDLSPAFDVCSLRTTALSPGNPQRYSINDFSMFSNDGNVGWDPNGQAPASGNTEPIGFRWTEWDFPVTADPSDMNNSDNNNNNNNCASNASSQGIYPYSGDVGFADLRNASQPSLSRYSPGDSSSDQGYGSSISNQAQMNWNSGVNSNIASSVNMPWAVASQDVKDEAGFGLGRTSCYQDSMASLNVYQPELPFQDPNSLNAQNTKNLNVGVDTPSPANNIPETRISPVKYEGGPEALNGMSQQYFADDDVSSWTPNSEPDGLFATSPDFDINSNASPNNEFKPYDENYHWLPPQQTSPLSNEVFSS